MSSTKESACVQFDLSSQAFKENPFPTLAKMRELGPVIRVRFPLFGKVWMATTYEAVHELLRDYHRFVQNPATAGNRWMGAILRWLPETLKPLATNMLLRDPPDHRRLRGLVDQAFQRQSVEALRPRLETLADEALDRLAEQAARSSGVDLLAHFAPLPARGYLRAARPATRSPSEFHPMGLALLHLDQLLGHPPGAVYRRGQDDALRPRGIPAADPAAARRADGGPDPGPRGRRPSYRG
jgi:cytochrome P450